MRDMIGNSDHLWMWDEMSITKELKRQGFTFIRRCYFGDLGISMFDSVEEPSRFYDADLGIQECAIEARKSLKE